MPPPIELAYKWRIDTFGSPYSGGWMEWPAGLINRMGKLYTVNSLMSTYRKCDKSLAKVKEKHGKEAYFSVVKLLKELDGI